MPPALFKGNTNRGMFIHVDKLCPGFFFHRVIAGFLKKQAGRDTIPSRFAYGYIFYTTLPEVIHHGANHLWMGKGVMNVSFVGTHHVGLYEHITFDLQLQLIHTLPYYALNSSGIVIFTFSKQHGWFFHSILHGYVVTPGLFLKPEYTGPVRGKGKHCRT